MDGFTKRVAVVTAVALATLGAAQPTDGVSRATALKIERQIELPREASPLTTYARFYYRDPARSDGLITAEYVYSGDDRMSDWPEPGIYLSRPTVRINDGGCMMMWVYYDPYKDRVVAISCNGYA